MRVNVFAVAAVLSSVLVSSKAYAQDVPECTVETIKAIESDGAKCESFLSDMSAFIECRSGDEVIYTCVAPQAEYTPIEAESPQPSSQPAPVESDTPPELGEPIPRPTGKRSSAQLTFSVGGTTHGGNAVSGYGHLYGVGFKMRRQTGLPVLPGATVEVNGVVGGVDHKTVGRLSATGLVEIDPAAKNAAGVEASYESGLVAEQSLFKVVYVRKLGPGKLKVGLVLGHDKNPANDATATVYGAEAGGVVDIKDWVKLDGVLNYAAQSGTGRDMITEVEILSPLEQRTIVTRTGLRENGANGTFSGELGASHTFGASQNFSGVDLRLHGKITDRYSNLEEYGFETIGTTSTSTHDKEVGITATIPWDL